MAYTTFELVSAYLDTTDLVSSDVSEYIAWADSHINLRTNMVWSSSAVSSEVMDYWGGDEIITKGFPLIEVTKIEENTGTEFSPIWTEISSSDYYISNKNSGEIRTYYSYSCGNRKLRLTYTKGYETTPSIITDLATRLVVKQIINKSISGTANSSNSSIRIGSIAISNSSGTSYGYLNTTVTNELNELWKVVGSFRIYLER